MEGDLSQLIGRDLRRYRIARGLSQAGFAEAVGVRRTYMRALREERNLTLRLVDRIAAQLAVEPLTLMQTKCVSQCEPAARSRLLRDARIGSG